MNVLTNPLTSTSASQSTTAYAGTHITKLSPLACPYCQHELRAHDVELLDGGDARIVCPACHRDLLTIER